MTRIENLIQEMELDYIEFAGKSLEDRKLSLPIIGNKHLKALIWNLLTSEVHRSRLSYKDYSQVMDVWISRVDNNSIK